MLSLWVVCFSVYMKTPSQLPRLYNVDGRMILNEEV
jgi:hypothetical protein